MCVAGPVLDVGIDHTELEGGDMFGGMHVRMAGGRKRAAQVRHLGQIEGMVGETEVPKLFILLVCRGWAMRDIRLAQGKGPQPCLDDAVAGHSYLTSTENADPGLQHPLSE